MKKKQYKECDNCGKKFLMRNYNQRYCSNECREEIHNEFKARAVQHYRKYLKQIP